MDKLERKKLFSLLRQFYPNAKQLNAVTMTAWAAVLENYDYAPVKAAVLDYAAHNKYFPDLSDLLAPLHAQQAAQTLPPAEAPATGSNAWMKPYIEKYMKGAKPT